MARKGWESLSPTYRQRLERGGITRKSYESGTALHAARGKKSAQHESQRDRFRRLVNKFDFDPDEVQEVIDSIGFDEAYDILTMRDASLHPHDETERHLAAGAMRTLYGQYEGLVPKEWLYYHGGAK